jgi:type IV secretory pathway VirB4 component
LAENIKRARAAVCPETINEYFDNLDTSLQDVKPKNVVNYDETNFVDDPGRRKVIVRRSVKHAEKIIDSSKTATSVMFAGTASGRLLPLMIV